MRWTDDLYRSAAAFRRCWLRISLGTLLIAGACARPSAVPSRPAGQVPSASRIHVLMIDGGGSRARNYQSHLLQLRALLGVLLREGVAPGHITIFSADGADPSPDLAVRQTESEKHFWLLRGTWLERYLRTPITYINSTVPGMHLHAATKAGLDAWFKRAAQQLRPGDMLLLYVTDHGAENSKDTANNRIVLWGTNESLSVHELHGLLDKLDPRVRIVSLMSQCYSGAFANLSDNGAGGLPSGNVCGYFSSTADRPAYGCYPENLGKNNIGHSFEFIEALRTQGNFPGAHRQVLVNDRTPDVPLRSSDIYLQNLLQQVGDQRGVPLAAVVDPLLRDAWQDKAAWESQIRLLDDIAHAVGYFSPRSLAELQEQSKLLPGVSAKLKRYATVWRSVLSELTQENLKHFLGTHRVWRKRLTPAALAKLDSPARQRLTAALLFDLARFTDAHPGTASRLHLLRRKADDADAASYRMQVRLGVVLRMRAVLTSIAGQVYVRTTASEAERAAYRKLAACENVRLGPTRPVTAPRPVPPKPFPSYANELRLARAVSPAWMGIRFKPAAPIVGPQRHVNPGAVAVVTVYPDSPAQAAGFEVGDIILGPPGAPFAEPFQIREWTMLSPLNHPEPLEVLRGSRRRRLTLTPKPYPLVWPALPGPPAVGSLAPPLKLQGYRGQLPKGLVTGVPHLLFFWATWCAPCKASLAELHAFARARHVQVLAITDELPKQLDTFFAAYRGWFPHTVAIDAYRRAFVGYGVSGTPTFVLVDGQGRVQSYSTGYTLTGGLGIPGWTWTERPPSVTSKAPAHG